MQSNDSPIGRAVDVAKSFDEKAHQLSVGSLTAYGIDLSTRYSKCGEMIELLQFASLAAQAGAASLVKSVFYDSKANLCNFEWHGALDAEADAALRQCADQSISQYIWSDGMIGGKSYPEGDEDD